MKQTLVILAVVIVVGGVGYAVYSNSSAPPDAGTEAPEHKEATPTTPIDQPVSSGTETVSQGSLRICSFNIQFLGNFKDRDNKALTSILTGYDLVVIQELVAPPYAGTFPDGTPYKPDTESAAFFDEMKALGFSFTLSEEDTGTGDNIHVNSPSTEWWVAFYKPESVQPASDLPSGFLAGDRSNNPDFERVPYAFAFKTPGGILDFVLISVHLQPGDGSSDKARRKHELTSIASWIHAHDSKEKDFIILGDMNIEDRAELDLATPSGFLSLNDECRRTNTLHNADPNGGAKPYDHVMYNTTFTANDIDIQFDMKVIDLIEAMRPTWTGPGPYPGDPYNHDEFRKRYSDHNPVEFRMKIAQQDED